jgi:hypothetical protein
MKCMYLKMSVSLAYRKQSDAKGKFFSTPCVPAIGGGKQKRPWNRFHDLLTNIYN